MKKLSTIAIIPSRYKSTRFPGKALADIDGKSLIERVYSQVVSARKLDDVIAATDDDRILDAVRKFGGKAVMTSGEHKSGTDRIAEVAKDIDCDLVINVQGDEPLIPPELIDMIIELFERDENLPCATAAHVFEHNENVNSPHTVKVVADSDWNALYFSRAAIPYKAELDKEKLKQIHSEWKGCLRHIGIYAFRKEILMKFVELEPSPLERLEHLEQLRLIENGIKIKVVLTDYQPIAVDTPEDIKLVLKAQKTNPNSPFARNKLYHE